MAPRPPALLAGGHTFAVRDAASGSLLDPCSSCHPISVVSSTARYGTAAEEFVIDARGDWDGQGGAGTVQEEVVGLLQLLGGAAAPAPDAPFGIVSEPTATTSLLMRLAQKIDPSATGVRNSHGRLWIVTGVGETAIPATADGDVLFYALYNYYFSLYDGSMGLHNTGYTVGLLQSSVIEIGRSLGDPAFPGAPYLPF
jgi:hypothetical protein